MDDPCHARFYESTQKAVHATAVIFEIVQFLHLRTDLRRQLSYDNLYPVFLDIVHTVRPDLCQADGDDNVYYATYFLKQDVLLPNLRKKN